MFALIIKKDFNGKPYTLKMYMTAAIILMTIKGPVKIGVKAHEQGIFYSITLHNIWTYFNAESQESSV